MKRIVHYVNQFFGQIGGEEKAGLPPMLKQGPVGPGVLIDKLFGGRGKVVATAICGDNYFSENTEEAAIKLLDMISEQKPDALIAGPAFNAGRYGIACGEICKLVKEELGIPSVTGMYRENPGVELYRRHVYIVETTSNAAGMSKAMAKGVDLVSRLLYGGSIGKPSEEGYFPRGIKKDTIKEKLASTRAIELLLRKIRGEPFETEIPFALTESVPSALPIPDLSQARIAIVTEGGLYPKGNPDKIESIRATRYAKYSIRDLTSLRSGDFESIHKGFDTKFINEDPNRLVPLDILREMEKENTIKELFPCYFVTTGVAMSIENAKRIGQEIAGELKSNGISGAILTAT